MLAKMLVVVLKDEFFDAIRVGGTRQYHRRDAGSGIVVLESDIRSGVVLARSAVERLMLRWNGCGFAVIGYPWRASTTPGVQKKAQQLVYFRENLSLSREVPKLSAVLHCHPS